MATTMNALKAAEKARAKGGLALFPCPKRVGELKLTPTTCAKNHKDSKVATEDDLVRLWECRGCEVGAANLAAIRILPAGRRDRSLSYMRGGSSSQQGLPKSQQAALEFLRVRGRATAPDAAKHFGLHRDTMADRFLSLERAGMVRRVASATKTLVWEVV